jgi:hypothetical protein
MTARTEHGSVRQLRNYGSRIVGVFSKRPVTRLTVHTRMFSGSLHLKHVAVAILATLMTGIGERLRRKLFECGSPIVAVLSKTLWNKVRSHQQEHDEHKRKSSR